MKTFYLFIVVAILAGCSKSDGSGSTPTPTPPETLVDTVRTYWVIPVNEAQGYDTTNNYIATFHFGNGSAYGTIAQYTASSGSGIYKVRYVAAEPLFHPDSVISRGGSLIDFKMNKNLQGKPVFEIYNSSTGTIYKRYFAANSAVVVRASFSVFDNYVVTNRKIGESMLYYIASKLTDATLFRKG